jgi:hypothetical protein
MQSSFNPAVLSSSPLRKLYEVLSVFEAQRDWSNVARAALLDKVAARLPPTHQPDIFLLHSMLEELGVDASSLSGPAIEDNEDVLGTSLLSRSSKYFQQENKTLLSNGGGKSVPALSPQLANLMTTREMAAFVMLQLFGEMAEKRIESWGRIARLIITQPMDGFATTEFPR